MNKVLELLNKLKQKVLNLLGLNKCSAKQENFGDSISLKLRDNHSCMAAVGSGGGYGGGVPMLPMFPTLPGSGDAGCVVHYPVTFIEPSNKKNKSSKKKPKSKKKTKKSSKKK